MEPYATPHPAALEVTLAPFDADDVEAIAELARACAARRDEGLGSREWSDAAVLEQELEGWPVRAAETLYVARESGRVIGFCGVEAYADRGIGMLHGPVVEPSLRGQGVGRALLDVVLGIAERTGARELWSVTGRDNRRAHRLIERNGFVRAEVTALFRLEREQHAPLPVPMDVRRAGEDDLAAIRTLAGEIGDLHMTDAQLAGALCDPAWHVWVAGHDELRAIACIDPVERWVGALGTRPDARRRGLGATVLSAALENFWTDSPDVALGLSVRAESLSVVMQYNRLGFEPERIVARHVRSQ
jgi:GNAT superfamily N-acetyltransferase